VLLPTDTVYRLCAMPYAAEPADEVYRLKGRASMHPTAIVATDVDMLFECVPELRGRPAAIARAVLPGPFTLVMPNPAQRYRWLTGSRPDTIGLRVPNLPPAAAAVLARVGAVLATSANRSGGADPRKLDDVPDEIRAAVGAEIDGGELPGVPSTVVDCTGDEPAILRDGAVPAADALATIRAALA